MKKVWFVLFVFFCSDLFAQDMMWMRVAATHDKLYFRMEERAYSDFSQKTFLVDGRISFCDIVHPILGIGYWHHKQQPEPRLYQGLEYNAFRVLVEERFFDDFKLRVRARLRLSEKITDKTRIVLSEEIFWQEGFDHNRMCVTLQRKFNGLVLETGYMSYYKKEGNQDTFLIFITWNI